MQLLLCLLLILQKKHEYIMVYALILFVILIGGNGSRKLPVIPLEAEGYTGAILRSTSEEGSLSCALFLFRTNLTLHLSLLVLLSLPSC